MPEHFRPLDDLDAAFDALTSDVARTSRSAHARGAIDRARRHHLTSVVGAGALASVALIAGLLVLAPWQGDRGGSDRAPEPANRTPALTTPRMFDPSLLSAATDSWNGPWQYDEASAYVGVDNACFDSYDRSNPDGRLIPGPRTSTEFEQRSGSGALAASYFDDRGKRTADADAMWEHTLAKLSECATADPEPLDVGTAAEARHFRYDGRDTDVPVEFWAVREGNRFATLSMQSLPAAPTAEQSQQVATGLVAGLGSPLSFDVNAYPEPDPMAGITDSTHLSRDELDAAIAGWTGGAGEPDPRIECLGDDWGSGNTGESFVSELVTSGASSAARQTLYFHNGYSNAEHAVAPFERIRQQLASCETEEWTWTTISDAPGTARAYATSDVGTIWLDQSGERTGVLSIRGDTAPPPEVVDRVFAAMSETLVAP